MPFAIQFYNGAKQILSNNHVTCMLRTKYLISNESFAIMKKDEKVIIPFKMMNLGMILRLVIMVYIYKKNLFSF